MYYTKFVLQIIFSLAIGWFFIRTIYYKIKLYGIRKELQKKEKINKIDNLAMVTLISLIFWLIPSFKYYSLGNVSHNQVVIKINYSILIMLVLLMIFIFGSELVG